MFRSKLVPVVMATALAVGAAGLAQAESGKHEAGDRQEIQTILSAKTSLSQAVAAAERQTGGKAMEAALEPHAGGSAYAVTIAEADGARLVLVSPDSGKVLAVTAAKSGGDEEREDDD
ncbi:Peptidase propeptide and YPEB domain-containing protein [Tistlia consotensis]|uniref:Peptidase propeptide and YPEB domain-containing protein n=1 Tax=Tistlia consotensis USBA 355 TaxID=560819 RepID=A0A1Y6CUD5_9PROT|nr:PepSY domain-containing protein [Tistlia consotensis]SMF77735.1 Peptidase propeptide and YPEB domain-containing protein [Tistlia consotensis USBA 355]SNS20733.1 Peptidase propeptide and YPEB domain-containing protein [Tistlia consotensis]